MTNEDEINIFDCLIVLAKRKNLIIITMLFFAVAAVIHSFAKPLIYTAETIILPPVSSKSNFQQILGELPGFDLSGLSGKSNGLDNPWFLTEILYTETVSAILNKKLRAIKKYKDIKPLESLDGKMKIGTNKNSPSQALILSVTDKDPALAADLANIAVEALNERLQQIAITSASQKRLFYEQQLKEARENLIRSEQNMAEFQEKTGVLEVGGNVNIAVDKFAPELLLEYKRILRQLKFDEKIFEIMLSQHESAGIDEAESPPIIQVLERADPPSKATRKIFRKLVIVTFAAFLMSVIAAFFLEYIEKQLAIKENRDRLETIKKYLLFKKNI